MYKRTIEANGELSDWNAQANLIDKSDNLGEWNEPRLTFNYQNVIEDNPGCFVVLSSTTHDFMGHPSHKLFHKLDSKHGYWAISVHLDDRKYFAFSIAGIGQLQPRRMPQGFITSIFSFTELIYIVLRAIPATDNFKRWDSLLASSSPNSLPKVAFYVDDIFSGFEHFDQGYDILENQLLPRLVWAKLKLSFKKLELFVASTTVLGVLHKAGDVLITKLERCERIRNWPVSKNTTDIRKFLGAVGFTWRYVKNFPEIRKPLSRLTRNMEFTWESREQVSFQIPKGKCAEAVEMHGWNYLDPVKMYTDASIYGGGCVITQERIDSKGNLTEVPLIYDTFTFSKSQQEYGIYKKELCSIVEFARKYNHMSRGQRTSLILTNHKPLTWFLNSSSLDGMYFRWAAELRSLNIDIVWIQSKRNIIADALSRTIFPDGEFNAHPLEQFRDLLKGSDSEPQWIWKDNRGGYEELREIGEPIHDFELKKYFRVEHPSIYVENPSKVKYQSSTHSNIDQIHALSNLSEIGIVGGPSGRLIPNERYLKSEWCSDVAQYLTYGSFPKACTTKVQILRFCVKPPDIILVLSDIYS
ncbi:hypothetical protein K3495_g11651 [Podosphaera aphanis]|nr:hypothetical protein K3495_g11651 [Podosphaera aphanis]